MAVQTSELMSVTEAARYFNRTPRRILQMIDERKLPGVRIGNGKRVWIPRSWLEAQIEKAIAEVEA